MEECLSGQLTEMSGVQEQALSAGGPTGSALGIRICQQAWDWGRSWVSEVEKV